MTDQRHPTPPHDTALIQAGATRLEPSDPARIGPYVPLGRLGSGGMGRVYLGRPADGGPGLAAVKVIRPEYAEDPEFRRRFEREAAVHGRVRTPHAPQLLGTGFEDTVLWMATQYVPGVNLADAVREGGALTPAGVWRLVAELGQALAALAAAGVVHRDLKPSNVLLSTQGVHVIDFGISQAVDSSAITGTGSRVGTPAFMSPEYLREGRCDGASDVFSLAGTLIYAATGHAPFGDGTGVDVMHRVAFEEPKADVMTELSAADPELATLLTSCLAKDPTGRPTPQQLITAATTARAADPLPTWQEPLSYRLLSRQNACTQLQQAPAPGTIRLRAPGAAGADPFGATGATGVTQAPGITGPAGTAETARTADSASPAEAATAGTAQATGAPGIPGAPGAPETPGGAHAAGAVGSAGAVGPAEAATAGPSPIPGFGPATPPGQYGSWATSPAQPGTPSTPPGQYGAPSAPPGQYATPATPPGQFTPAHGPPGIPSAPIAPRTRKKPYLALVAGVAVAVVAAGAFFLTRPSDDRPASASPTLSTTASSDAEPASAPPSSSPSTSPSASKSATTGDGTTEPTDATSGGAAGADAGTGGRTPSATATHGGGTGGDTAPAPTPTATVTKTATAPTEPAWISDCTYYSGTELTTYGDKNQRVVQVQCMLTKRGYSVGSAGVDGQFGKDTLTAVKSFQSAKGLEVDGDVGPNTWAALRSST
jgi:predicted Ser/Thr protein kinase